MKITSVTTRELVQRFVDISEAQGEAMADGNTAAYNRLFDRKKVVIDELRRRDGDQRRALLELRGHPDIQVRLNAAKTTYALDPVGARSVLEEISNSRRFPWAGHAGMSIAMLDEGLSQLPNDP